MEHTAKLRSSTMQSHRYCISVYCRTNSRFVFTFLGRQHLAKKLSSEASILTDRLVEYICHNLNCAQGKRSLRRRWNFISNLIEFTLPWRRTLNIFPRCLYTDRDLGFRQCTRGRGAKQGRSLVMAKRACMRCPKPPRVEVVLWSGMERVWKKFHVDLWLGASGWSSSHVYIASGRRINTGSTRCLRRQVTVHSPRLGATGDFRQAKLSLACPTTAAPH